MIPIKEIYDDVALDNVNSAENGNLNFDMFNRLSKRGELRMLDYLSGDVENIKPPIPYVSQKNKDWLSPLLEKISLQVVDGFITRPANYYGYEDIYLLGNFSPNGNEHIQIELLDSDEFNERCNTDIEDLKPSFLKPVAKEVGLNFEFMPKDIGSVVLEYKRYPVYGKIVAKYDPQYNDEVVDEVLSTNYEYDEFAREILVYFITDMFTIHTRELALKQTNQATGKLERG